MKNNRSNIIGELLTRARNKAGISQFELAKRMGISRSTVNNWETGYSSPDMDEFFEWYEALGLNPGADFYTILHPELMDGLSGSSSDEDVLQALHEEIDSLTVSEARGVLYILHSYHGGDRYAVIQETLANLQCPMRDRHKICNQIIQNYEDALHLEEIACPDNIQPDIPALKAAWKKGRQAALNNQNAYV